MKTIENSKDITTLEVDDRIIFGNLRYRVAEWESVCNNNTYFLYLINNDKESNEAIFKALNLNKKEFIQKLGLDACFRGDFPEVKSLEVLTVIVSALFKEYEKQNNLPKTWEEFCKRNIMGDKKFCLSNGVIIGTGVSQNIVRDATLIESAEEAQAFRALMQLRQLRKVYIRGWKPNWESAYAKKYCINLVRNNFKIDTYWEAAHILSFPTYELAEQFLNNFKDLLELIKPLYNG